ncbi:MAG: hypothetical protein OXP12_08070 [Thaumarchaeota archaeon]|nr:hypothetical protein [Nitrososphaerota archaeon]MDE0267364.1 hypothetical protein [Nitrososphaerota archaeon]MDE0525147.1 hypothetical protein [Nitrososphaerota archaeon]
MATKTAGATEAMPADMGNAAGSVSATEGVEDHQGTRPYYIQLESCLDFSRLVCALENVPSACMAHKHGDVNILCAQADVMRGRPIIYYVPFDGGNGPAAGHHLYYGLRRGREEHGTSAAMSDSSMAYSPIIRIRSLPGILLPDSGAEDKYHPIILEDLSSLIGMMWGRVDSPFPLLLFRRGRKWLLGATLEQGYGDAEAPALFAYVELDSDPAKPFLMFSTQSDARPAFVDAPTEHGYLYLKIIRLKGSHPLIDYEDV